MDTFVETFEELSGSDANVTTLLEAMRISANIAHKNLYFFLIKVPPTS